MTSNLLMLFKSSTVWRCLKSVPRPDGIAAGTALAPTSQAGLSHRALHQHAPTIPGRKQSTEAKRSKAKQSPYCLSQYVTKLVTMAYNGDAIRSTRQIKTMQSFNQFHSKCNQLEINLKSTWNQPKGTSLWQILIDFVTCRIQFRATEFEMAYHFGPALQW